MPTMSVPDHFGLVAGVVTLSFIVHGVYMATGVMAARKKFNVDYPDLYATADNCSDEKARKAFNCVQRGHQNSLEMQPMFLAALIMAGLQNPITASALGCVYLIGRCGYFAGYATGTPNGRLPGSVFAYCGFMGLLYICGKAGVQSLRSLL